MRFFAKCFDLKGWKSCLFGVLLTKKKLRALISSLAVHRRVKSSSVPCCEYISDLFSVLDRSSESKTGARRKKANNSWQISLLLFADVEVEVDGSRLSR